MSTKIFLTFNLDALRQTLRHAFGKHDSVVQELLQNARRAGATQIALGYDEASQTLEIEDDGIGIADFQAMLEIGTSGWNEAVSRQEKPYGMGFLAAIYAAKRVKVESQGLVLEIDTEAALAEQGFDVQAAEPGTERTIGARITLTGFKWEAPTIAVRQMAMGFPVPISFNSTIQSNHHALREDATPTPVGSLMLANVPEDAGLTVYLQGFRVHQSGYGGAVNIVHLDSTKFYGKFPDRDVVVDQEDMLDQVRAELKSVLVARLLRLKQELEPLDFCDRAYRLASSVGRLDVFNDIDVMPGDWLSVIAELPHDLPHRESFLEHRHARLVVTKDEVLRGEVLIADLLDYAIPSGFTDEPEQQQINMAWLFAYAADMLVLTKGLDSNHWVHDLLAAHEETVATIEPYVPLHQGEYDGRHAAYLHCEKVRIVKELKLRCGDRVVTLEEPIFVDSEEGFLVPIGDDGVPPWLGSATLRQRSPYRDDDDLDDDSASQDEKLINDFIRELAASSEVQRAEHALTSAVRQFERVFGQRLTIEIGHNGGVKVLSLESLPKPEPVEEPVTVL